MFTIQNLFAFQRQRHNLLPDTTLTQCQSTIVFVYFVNLKHRFADEV